MKSILLCLLLMVITFLTGNAQSVSPELIATVGQHDVNANNQVSWTIGEGLIATESNGSNMLTQGFHQTHLIINAVGEVGDFGIKVYPNPVKDQFSIQVEDIAGRELEFRLVDMSGKVLLGGQIDPVSGLQRVSVENATAGSYLLQITDKLTSYSQAFNIRKIR